MKNQRSSVDGFIPRRPGSQLGELHDENRVDRKIESIDRTLHTGDSDVIESVGVARTGKELGRDDLAESLRQIDESSDGRETRKQARQRRKERRANRPKSRTRRIVFWTFMILLLAGLGVGGYVVYKGVMAGGNVFQGNIFDVLTKSDPLREDANGRTNFVVFGTAEDDEGGTHGGANLTDSIMVVSVDQDKKNAYMLSLPRDLWVEYEEQCMVGDYGKLNATYFCASDDGANEAEGARALREKVSEITGLDVQYYVHLNFTAVVEAVDAIGGVDVTIESSDPRGILDRNFDWKCNYKCYLVNYENGETAHLDGERALALARARNASGGYGLPNGNFDREKNQQLILKAIREKASSAGTLTNVSAVTGLLDALGNNLRTNIETREIRTIMDLASDIPSGDIVSLSLNEEGATLVTTGSYNEQSIVRPIAGLLEYKDIHAYVKKNILGEPFVKENPHLTVLNGTGTSGVAQIEADALEDIGFIVDTVGTAPGTSYEGIEIYQLHEDKAATAAKLEKLYGVTIKSGTPPVSVVGETDFVIIIGDSTAAIGSRS